MKNIYEDFECILSNFGYVYKIEAAIDGLEFRIKKTPEPEVMRDYLENVKNACTYADSEMNPVSSEVEATYMLIGTGYIDERTGESIVFSFVKKPSDWCGAYVGTYTSLKNRLKTAHNKNKVNGETTEKDRLDQEVISRALIPEPWAEILTNGRMMITSYRVGIEGKIINNINKNVHQGYVESIDKSKILFNLGILDRLSDYIYVVATIEKYVERSTDENGAEKRTNRIRLVNGHIVNGQAELLNEGFRYEDIKVYPDPVNFYEDSMDLTFSGQIDIHCTRSFVHSVYERADRIPEGIDVSEKKLADCIRSSINSSLVMQKLDYNFVKPIYSPRFDQICYLMPLYITGTLGEKPDLAIVIKKDRHFASFKTIIGLGEAYADARVLGYPENSWLKKEWCFT
ncbi:MAG: DUF3825 domain-containing protein [Lachnospiraceae bacterium]|nr:DUF3825 domain-containing protein [Lachnospiraceae bacterium]